MRESDIGQCPTCIHTTYPGDSDAGIINCKKDQRDGSCRETYYLVTCAYYMPNQGLIDQFYRENGLQR